MSMFDSNQEKQSTSSGNGVYSVTFEQMPMNLDQLTKLPEASLEKAHFTAALTVAALCLYPVDQNAAIEMLNFLKGPQPLSTYEKQFMVDRFRGKDYIGPSYFNGATPENNYEPTKPYTITLLETPYSASQLSEGYFQLYAKSGGADSPRPIKLRQKPSTGQWFLWEQMLLGDIRQPKASDPWA